MKMTKKLFLFMFLNSFNALYSINSKIILFLRQYPSLNIKNTEKLHKTISQKLQQPDYALGKASKKKKSQEGSQGILAFYLGYANLSDKNGEIAFPRKHQIPNVNLLITKSIQPVYILAPSTIHNWMLDKNTTSEMYHCKFLHDHETSLFYIETSKIPLPENAMIPLDTIIIISDPKDVFVPLGATIAQYSPNLVLPNIYIKKDFDYGYNALYTLSIKYYFEQIHSEYKPETQTIAELLR
ncbi:hypothetical protein HYV11_00600 [Candidatus Dependentiae bacterium]|nr:hypothetical protein [Candidatus Dependentiae bacterium]